MGLCIGKKRPSSKLFHGVAEGKGCPAVAICRPSSLRLSVFLYCRKHSHMLNVIWQKITLVLSNA